MRKIAVVLFNLGGPDDLGAVKPFLFNLFNDKAIIPLPQPLRLLLAKFISLKRSKKAQWIYQQMGGRSPILEMTRQQATALEMRLRGKEDHKVFVSMRYWNPMSKVVAKNVQQYDPDHIVLLPLYPQFSNTTTGSSFEDWDAACDAVGLKKPTSKVCCYPAQKSFAVAHARLIREYYWKAAEFGKPRILFSAHGLPEKNILAGDPYQFQVEKTVASVIQILSIDDLDHSVCYQSKVGKLAWIGPSTDEEIVRAGEEGRPVVVVPIAFVSEHSETLVELDIEYKHLAEQARVPSYNRVPALGTEPFFIEALADIVNSKTGSTGISSDSGERFCLRQFAGCPCKG